METTREYNFFDKICIEFDNALRTVFTGQNANRVNPSEDIPEPDLTTKEKKHISGLMRINHVGEVCAQALYQGQALVARDNETREKLQQASDEENDHLAWCEERLNEFQSHTSFLNPLWYMGAFALGVGAGLLGDKWSLGFIAETEKQVVAHLASHLEKLPPEDKKTQAILSQMKIDEQQHQQMAIDNGGEVLPEPIPTMMTFMSKIMTSTAYYI